jgi:hypothetical protein
VGTRKSRSGIPTNSPTSPSKSREKTQCAAENETKRKGVSCRSAAKRLLAITRCEAPVFCRAWWHRGDTAHRAGSWRFRAAFRDNKVEHPYDILLGDREYTAFVGHLTATFTGPLELSDGTVTEPIGNAFEVVFSTIARSRVP